MKTHIAYMEWIKVLNFLLSIGYTKSDIPALEKIFWRVRDHKTGKVKKMRLTKEEIEGLKENPLQPVRAVQDDNCHWYVIPTSLKDKFYKDLSSDDFARFDEEYRKYRTGGDLNNIQLYAAI